MPIEYTFCFICCEKCLRNNSSRKYIGFLSVFMKIIADGNTRKFQKVGGVTQPLIFHQRQNIF